jgi:UDP-GlcNAc3NAcA epimerase
LIKIATVLGARPQFVKAALLSSEFKASEKIDEIIIHSGQHFDFNMNDIFFNELQIPVPNYNLNIHSLPHAAMTGRIMEETEKILQQENPDYCLVYGDTNSTLAGALASKKMNIKVIHVEAGLRSFNMKMPEEINRILTDRISDILFCPTKKAEENLLAEGFSSFNCSIIRSGDIMLDMVRKFSDENILKNVTLPFEIPPDFLLCTIHRQENTDDEKKLKEIFSALAVISKRIKIILPLHPRTKKIISELNIKLPFETFPPFSYLQMIKLIKKSSMVITDSGGLQKESYFLQRPCVTVRDETEWVELVEAGQNFIAGSSSHKILEGFEMMMNKEISFDNSLYGDGTSRKKIISEILAQNN